jgi:hypothetical protein
LRCPAPFVDYSLCLVCYSLEVHDSDARGKR